MLPHIGAAGAAAATPHCREVESAECSTVTFDVPRGACDSHVHIFADPAVGLPVAPIRRRGLDRGASGVASRAPYGARRGRASRSLRHRQFLLGRSVPLRRERYSGPAGLACQNRVGPSAYQITQFVRGHLGSSDGYTAETRCCGRSDLAGCKHIPAKQFFVALDRSAFCPATFGPRISG
jgi:hypothetical protein